MHKFSLALGAIIAITVMMAIPMMAIPTTNFHIVTAYSAVVRQQRIHALRYDQSHNANQYG